jgi:hypothetical protein
MHTTHHTLTNTHTDTHKYTHTHTDTYQHMYAHIHSHTQTHKQTQTTTHTHTHTRARSIFCPNWPHVFRLTRCLAEFEKKEENFSLIFFARERSSVSSADPFVAKKKLKRAGISNSFLSKCFAGRKSTVKSFCGPQN